MTEPHTNLTDAIRETLRFVAHPMTAREIAGELMLRSTGGFADAGNVLVLLRIRDGFTLRDDGRWGLESLATPEAGR